MAVVPRDELTELCRLALLDAGADPAAAGVLAEATTEAELVGNRAVGVAHLFDYLDGYRTGRITRQPRTALRRAAGAVLDVDAAGGIAQTVFVETLGEFEQAIRHSGLAALWIKNSFTCGELGYYPRRLAADGFIAVAMANSPALMSLGGAPTSILGTNPLAYGFPRSGARPMVIDQASSSTAFVNIRRAADAGEPIPAGWALGPDGQPTQDADAAMHGTLLPFGSHRGGNIALLVEILATLSGGSFSLDAAPFDRGDTTPGIGVFLLGIDPAVFPGSVDRLFGHLTSLRDERQVRLPALVASEPGTQIDVPDHTLQRLRDAVGTV